MIRDVLLVVHAAVWAIVVVFTFVRTGNVPAELWAVLSFGVGAILTAFAKLDKGEKDDDVHSD